MVECLFHILLQIGGIVHRPICVPLSPVYTFHRALLNHLGYPVRRPWVCRDCPSKIWINKSPLDTLVNTSPKERLSQSQHPKKITYYLCVVHNVPPGVAIQLSAARCGRAIHCINTVCGKAGKIQRLLSWPRAKRFFICSAYGSSPIARFFAGRINISK